MPVDYRVAVRRSFLSKLAIYLQQNGSRDMSIPLTFNQGIAEFVYGNTTYAIIPKQGLEEFTYPGVNILFLDEVDLSKGRSKKKRYSLAVKITVCKAIEGNVTPTIVATEVYGVVHKILEALQDSRVDIWDYSQDPPVYTGGFGSYHETGYDIGEESLAIEGGDIRQTITLLVNYADLSF